MGGSLGPASLQIDREGNGSGGLRRTWVGNKSRSLTENPTMQKRKTQWGKEGENEKKKRRDFVELAQNSSRRQGWEGGNDLESVPRRPQALELKGYKTYRDLWSSRIVRVSKKKKGAGSLGSYQTKRQNQRRKGKKFFSRKVHKAKLGTEFLKG